MIVTKLARREFDVRGEVTLSDQCMQIAVLVEWVLRTN